MVLVDFQTDLPNILRALRRKRGLSQEEAVKELDIARNTLSLYETGKLAPSLENLVKLLDFYGYRVTLKIEPKEDSAIIQALENEIKWSRDNALLAPDEEAAAWFVKGLEQAKWLVGEVSKLDSADDLSTLEPKDALPKNPPGWIGDYGATPFGPVDV